MEHNISVANFAFQIAMETGQKQEAYFTLQISW